MSGTEGHPADGGPWWCPTCDRVTVTNYRCSNWDCGDDLAGKELIAL